MYCILHLSTSFSVYIIILTYNLFNLYYVNSILLFLSIMPNMIYTWNLSPRKLARADPSTLKARLRYPVMRVLIFSDIFLFSFSASFAVLKSWSSRISGEMNKTTACPSSFVISSTFSDIIYFLFITLIVSDSFECRAKKNRLARLLLYFTEKSQHRVHSSGTFFWEFRKAITAIKFHYICLVHLYCSKIIEQYICIYNNIIIYK